MGGLGASTSATAAKTCEGRLRRHGPTALPVAPRTAPSPRSSSPRKFRFTELGRAGARLLHGVRSSEANEAAFKIARQFHAANVEQDPSGPLRYKITRAIASTTATRPGPWPRRARRNGKLGSGRNLPATSKWGLLIPTALESQMNSTGLDLAAALDETIRMEGAETVAAFICEPITSGGGVLVPPENYLKEVRRSLRRPRCVPSWTRS